MFLRETPIIAVTKRCLQRIHNLAIQRHGLFVDAMTPCCINVRVFLSAYLIVFKTRHVFEQMAKSERNVFRSAVQMLLSFESILKCIKANHSFQDVDKDVSLKFQPLLFEYLRDFKLWKVPDELKLTQRIKRSLTTLYNVNGHLSHKTESNLRIEFKTQIDRLRGKLEQIAGKDCLDEFDRLRSAQVAVQHVEIEDSYETNQTHFTNEELIHELLIDPAFQLRCCDGVFIEGEADSNHFLRELFYRDFFEGLVDDLQLDTPCYTLVIRVLCNIRDHLASFGGGRMYAATNAAINVGIIKLKVELELYEWGDCRLLISSITGIIRQVQYPKRDADFNAQWAIIDAEMENCAKCDQPFAFCKALEFLVDSVNTHRIDVTNTW